MSDHEPMTLLDYLGRPIRLTDERRAHILEHPEMVDQFSRLRETLSQPDVVIATTADATVHVYHRHYAQTPVTSKFLLYSWLFESDGFSGSKTVAFKQNSV